MQRAFSMIKRIVIDPKAPSRIRYVDQEFVKLV
jgi:hypothetical protein